MDGVFIVMKYKVGDYVRVIKKFDKNADYYSNPPFVVASMLPMQGKVYQIELVTLKPVYKLREPLSNFSYAFTDEMIEERVIPVSGNGSYIPYSENMEID